MRCTRCGDVVDDGPRFCDQRGCNMVLVLNDFNKSYPDDVTLILGMLKENLDTAVCSEWTFDQALSSAMNTFQKNQEHIVGEESYTVAAYIRKFMGKNPMIGGGI